MSADNATLGRREWLNIDNVIIYITVTYSYKMKFSNPAGLTR